MTASPSISGALKLAVQAAGMSAYDLSKKSGVSQSVLSRWMTGKRDITLVTADKIASGLGLDCRMSRPKKTPQNIVS